QVVAPHLSIDLHVADQADVEKARIFFEETVRQPFDLENGPLLRAVLTRVATDRHVFGLCLHHTIFDGGSLNVLQQELASLYEAYVGARSPELAPLPVQFRDYSAWQRNWLESGEMDRQLPYWREALGGTLPVLELPTDYARPAMHRYDGGSEMTEISPDMLAGLDSIARECKVTRFMVLLTAFNVLL